MHFPFAKYSWGAVNFFIGGKLRAFTDRAGPLSDMWRVALGVEPGLTAEYVKTTIASERLKKILPGMIHMKSFCPHSLSMKGRRFGAPSESTL